MKEILEQFSSICPDLTWDRYTESTREYSCYGWIKRKDDNKDFLVLNFMKLDKIHNVWFCTSSAKYSELFAELCKGKHSKCKKIKFNQSI